MTPTESLSQLLTYTQYASTPFDIVLANHDVAIDSGIDTYDFLSHDENIKNFVIYSASGAIKLDLDDGNSKAKLTLPGALGLHDCEDVDRHDKAQFDCRKKLADREASKQMRGRQRAS